MKKFKATILVVDDNKELVESIYAQFTYCGFEVIKAIDPRRAFELASSIKPDLIVADIRMPKLDGIALIKKFKEIQPNVRVILMTGYYSDYEDSIQEAIKTGLADKVIQKRFHSIDLERMVYDILKSPTDERRFSSNAKGKILFVDDEEEVTAYLKEFFLERGYAVAIAKSADEALTSFETFEPSIIVTDIKMPDRDGIWVVNELRKKYKDQSVQIVVMTGQDTHLVLERLKKETGIEEYIKKPFSLSDLEKIADKLEQSSKKNSK